MLISSTVEIRFIIKAGLTSRLVQRGEPIAILFRLEYGDAVQLQLDFLVGVVRQGHR